MLGDQLDLDAAAFDDFDCELDAVWMAEVAQKSTHVWSGVQNFIRRSNVGKRTAGGRAAH